MGPQAVEIVAQTMATDSPRAYDPLGLKKSMVEVAGSDMTRRAAAILYKNTGINPRRDIDVVELHDCFSANEVCSFNSAHHL